MTCPAPATSIMRLKELTDRLGDYQSDIEALFKLSIDMMCVIKNGIFTTVNPAWTKTLGYKQREIIGHSWNEFIHPDDQATTYEDGKSALADGSMFMYRNRFKHKDGSWKVLCWNAVAWSEDRICAIARDVTHEYTKKGFDLNEYRKQLTANLTASASGGGK
jgi:PAS domain S-box-containing protein